MSREMSQQSRVSGTGSYGNATVYRENLDNVEELTAAQVKAAYEAALSEDQAAQDRAENQLDGDAFITAHPEVKDTVANAKLFVHEMDRMFGPGRHPITHFEAANESLKASGFLVLDQNVLAAQQKQAAKQRYKTEREHITTETFDEREADSLPLEELRRRADEEVRQQNRSAGERGGYYNG